MGESCGRGVEFRVGELKDMEEEAGRCVVGIIILSFEVQQLCSVHGASAGCRVQAVEARHLGEVLKFQEVGGVKGVEG